MQASPLVLIVMNLTLKLSIPSVPSFEYECDLCSETLKIGACRDVGVVEKPSTGNMLICVELSVSCSYLVQVGN
ncbi:hypothetical protein M758_2G070200 [Ceratodon purpureus]|nr:hypothetical protein M758_2G070200 [Ceratodon purpureus]